MLASWDARVVPPQQVEFVRLVQRVGQCRLAGGAALSGVHLQHRLSHDLDLFCDERESVRAVLDGATQAATTLGGGLRVVRDGGAFVRAVLTLPSGQLELDIAHEPSAPLAPRDVVEGVTVDALDDLRANKLTCLLSRSEPRDLVDLYFLDQSGLAPESDLAHALSKDAGIDPGVLSFLLRDFPTNPLPQMLKPLTEQTLDVFRQGLAERFRTLSLP